jgi:putative membrane protein
MWAALAVACGGLTLVRPGFADEEKKADKKGGDDQEFVTKASGAGLAEVNLSNLALRKAASADVKRFARRMVDDHMRMNTDLLRIADRKQLSPAKEMDKKHQDASDKLAKLDGADFDHEYLSAMVADHKEAVDLFQKVAKDGKDADLKAFADRALPAIKDHLKMAQDLSGKAADAKKEDKKKDVKDKDEKK